MHCTREKHVCGKAFSTCQWLLLQTKFLSMLTGRKNEMCKMHDMRHFRNVNTRGASKGGGKISQTPPAPPVGGKGAKMQGKLYESLKRIFPSS